MDVIIKRIHPFSNKMRKMMRCHNHSQVLQTAQTSFHRIILPANNKDIPAGIHSFFFVVQVYYLLQMSKNVKDLKSEQTYRTLQIPAVAMHNCYSFLLLHTASQSAVRDGRPHVTVTPHPPHLPQSNSSVPSRQW